MADPITSDDDLRDAITDLLARFDLGEAGMADRWVLVYTTTGITDDGDVGGNWGYLAHAPIPTIVGLCTLTAADAPSQADD